MQLTYRYFSSLSRDPKYNYNHAKAIQMLYKIRYVKSEVTQQRVKIELFKMMHQFIVMHMDIYKAMCARDYDYSDHNSAFQREDLVSEFYIVFERCVMNYKFDLRDKKGKRINFYFYYKKSLKWCLDRLYKANHIKLQNMQPIGWDNDWVHNILHNEIEADFVDYLMDLWKLTEDEKNLVESKLVGMPIKDYIAEYGITSNEYYKQLTSVKDKLNTLILDGNFIHDQFVITKWFQDIGIGREQSDRVLLAGERLSNSR